MRRRLKILFSATIICLLSSAKISLATGYLKACSKGGSNIKDSSNCPNSFICDPEVGACVYPNEIACGNGIKCPLGSACFKESSVDGKMTPVSVKSTMSGEYGTCQISTNVSIDQNTLTILMCKLYAFMSGGLGKTLAAMIIMYYGGKLTLSGANLQLSEFIKISASIAVWFGAPTLVTLFFGGSIDCTEIISKEQI